jgi:hypothetical protein
MNKLMMFYDLLMGNGNSQSGEGDYFLSKFLKTLGKGIGKLLLGTLGISLPFLLLTIFTIILLCSPFILYGSGDGEVNVIENYELYKSYMDIEDLYSVPNEVESVENNYIPDEELIISIDTVTSKEFNISEKRVKEISEKMFTKEIVTRTRIEKYTKKKYVSSSGDYDYSKQRMVGGVLETVYWKIVHKEREVKYKVLIINNKSREEIYTSFKLNDEEIERIEIMEEQVKGGIIEALASDDYSLNIYDNEVNLDHLNIYDKGNANIVYYSQLDQRWGAKSYGNSTIYQSGCGTTALAMVVSSLKNEKIYPDEVSKYAEENGFKASEGGSYWSLISNGAKHYGLSVREISKYKPDEVMNELSLGNPVIAIMSKGHFTNGGHFIVLRGVTKDNKILVNDPASKKRTGMEWDKKIIFNEASYKGEFTFWVITK